MAEEPRPKTLKEGHDEDDVPPSVPASAEDRKTAAAMSKLDAHDEDVEKRGDVDTEALGKAMRGLDVKDECGEAKEGGEKKKKVVKVSQEDVKLLVEELDLSRMRATELLKAHEGDAVKALTAFVTASV